jgi:hypothetical protein
MSEIELLSRLKDQLTMFIDELIEILPTEPDLVIIRIFVKDQVPAIDIMKYIIMKIVPLKEMVAKKQADFFLQNNILFDQLDKSKVNHFKRIWLTDSVTEDNKEMIWEWFKVFINLAQRYQKLTTK